MLCSCRLASHPTQVTFSFASNRTAMTEFFDPIGINNLKINQMLKNYVAVNSIISDNCFGMITKSIYGRKLLNVLVTSVFNIF